MKDPKMGEGPERPQSGPKWSFFNRAFNRDPEDQIFPFFPLFPGQPAKSAKNTMKIHSGDTFAGKNHIFGHARQEWGSFPPQKRQTSLVFCTIWGNLWQENHEAMHFLGTFGWLGWFAGKKGKKWENWVLRVPIKTPIKKGPFWAILGPFWPPPHFWVFHILHWSYREIHVYCVIHV